MSQRQIIVTGNCQTGGVAAALSLMLPNDRIIPHAVINGSNAAANSQLRADLRSAEAWVTSASQEDQRALAGGLDVKIIRMPSIVFSAYHPDMTYVRQREAPSSFLKSAYGLPYSSAIGYWAYARGLSAEAAARLFTKAVFETLGYFDRWNADVKSLRRAFENAGLDFAAFFLHVRSPAPFMHTPNHPNISVLVQMAREIALQLGANRRAVDAAVERALPDGLATGGSILPVYPEVAEALATRGSYIWKIGEGKYVTNLEEYLRMSFAAYKAVDVTNYCSAAVDGLGDQLAQFI